MGANKLKFINMLKNEAKIGYERYAILPSLTIAQAILETGWGKASIGNNIFGIKANKGWTGKKKLVRTHEYVNGQKIYIDAWFRDYDSIYDSLEDRFKFLQAKRYSKVVGENDYRVACLEIWRAGYATDPNYPNKLIQIIEQNKLHEIDKEAIMLSSEKPIAKKPNNTPSTWARGTWEWATKEGLVDGNRPTDVLLREEFTAIISRMVN